MKTITVFILALSFSLTASAQPNPDTLWTRTYGGINDEYAFSVQQTTDGGYVLAGYTNSFGAGSYDFYLVKTDSLGDTLWSRTYGGTNNDCARSVQQTTDGGYIVVGYTHSFGDGLADFYAVKTNSQGDTVWTRVYGGSDNDYAYSVQQTTDGGHILAGHTHSFGAGQSDFYLVKTNSLGDTLWTRTFGGSQPDYASSVQQTTDGGYIVAGTSWSFNPYWGDIYLVKTDSLGVSLWTRVLGGSGLESAYSVQQTIDGGYIVAGITCPYATERVDLYLVKRDNQGDALWTRSFGGSHADEASSVRQTIDGGYVVTGYSESFGAGSKDFYLVRADSQGEMLWARTYGGGNEDRAYSVQQTGDDGYVVGGYTTSFGAGGNDFYLVKTGPDQLNSEPTNVNAPIQCALYPNFPNPFNASTQIVFIIPKASRVTLTVFNLLGEEVATLVNDIQSAGLHTVSFDGTSLASGVYLYRLQSERFVQTRKMVLLK